MCKIALPRQWFVGNRSGSNGVIAILHPKQTQHGLVCLHGCEKTDASSYNNKMLKHGPLRTANVHHLQVNMLHCQMVPIPPLCWEGRLLQDEQSTHCQWLLLVERRPLFKLFFSLGLH